MPRHPDMETARIITLSTAHLHQDTIDAIEACRGDLSEGPSIAVRDEGFLVNSHLGDPGAADRDLQEGLLPSLRDRHPDLALIRALARGFDAEWINLDVDGVVCSDILPVYDGRDMEPPMDPAWRAFLGETTTPAGILYPSDAALRDLGAGRIPEVDAGPQPD